MVAAHEAYLEKDKMLAAKNRARALAAQTLNEARSNQLNRDAARLAGLRATICR